MTSPTKPVKAPHHEVRIRVGDTEVSSWLDHVEIRNALRERLQAHIVLRVDVAASTNLDYSGQVEVDVSQSGKTYRRFTGVVDRVRTEGDLIHLFCDTGNVLVDSHLVGFIHENVNVPELIWSLARTAGYTEDRLQIEGVELIEPETIEVLVPLEGLIVEEPLSLGEISIVPKSETGWVVEPWTLSDPAQVGNGAKLTKDFEQFGAFARTTCIHARLYDAEQEAMRNAEFASAWLCMRLRLGSAQLPDGSIQSFNRVNSSVAIRPAQLVSRV